ncbi:prolyl 3-hydroxylase 1 [Triplophysa rosa]|uniref:procollagen-proline 3-dioxygenase n=1 Tax=Triplophysa rosa TaxID=992332 RepID=A0A9W7TFL5_TRIRA|nr:prolyl 3-hydroxylase 1 [Triplophysa rosa]KAI7795187.1 putative prolyl 3-hydroxylase 1 [Triplophysa rosa]
MWSARSLIIILSVLHFTFSETQISAILEPHDLLFDNAVEAYYKQDWLAVILNMEKALRNKGTVRKVQTQCRLSCADRDAFGDPFPGLGVPIPGAGPVEDLAFFQRILKRAECVNACESEKLGPPTLHKVSETVELEFKKRTPYNYLQVAYFKINKLDKAVAAANTFFIANPDHVEMKQNLEYYSLMAGVQHADFKDLEEKPHMTEFIEGKMQYSMEKFAPAIEHFEAAVEEYFTAYEECRVLCEGAFSYDNYMEYNADLFQAMTDHYLHALNCKQNCAVDLASNVGREKPFEDFLPSHFNYLQFSYYNSEKYEQAIECAKTYLLFHPEDEVMVQNLAYYSAVLGEDKAANISAREIVKQYINRSVLEKELLYFGYEIFGKPFVDPDTWTPENIMPKKLKDKQKADKETAARITEEIGNLMKEIETLVEEKSKESFDIGRTVKDEIKSAPTSASNSLPFDDITISMTSAALNGSQRVVLDGVTTYDECQELHSLSKAAALQGDEYKAKPSPLSQNEMFQELPVLKALQFGREGVVPLKSAQGFFNLTEKIRKVLESHFGLQSPLYFSSSNLVCRSVVVGKQEGHENGCLLVSELNECIKDPSAFSHGDYSAVLYLNQDFEGGDFFFTGPDAKTVTAVVKPQCGRVVAFGAGQENLHGVTSLTKGQRCAVAIRFTLDPHSSEKERLQAEELLKTLSNPATPDIQKTEDNNETKTSEPEVVVTPAETSEQDDKTSKPAETSETTGEQNTKAAEKKTNNKADKKSEKPKAKASKKPAKTEGQTKVKAVKTKSTATKKKKSKTANKTKPKTTEEKPPAKKKATGKNTSNDQKTKSKSTEPQNSKAEEDKDEL